MGHLSYLKRTGKSYINWDDNGDKHLVLVLISFTVIHCLIPHPQKKKKSLSRWRCLFNFTIPGYNPSFWASQGRNFKWLFTTYPKPIAERNEYTHAHLYTCVQLDFSTHRGQGVVPKEWCHLHQCALEKENTFSWVWANGKWS